MDQQQLALDIATKFFGIVYPHSRDPFKLSHGARGGVSAVLELQDLHPGDVIHSKAAMFAATDSSEVGAGVQSAVTADMPATWLAATAIPGS